MKMKIMALALLGSLMISWMPARAAYYEKAPDSPRLISRSLPPDFRPYQPPRRVDLADGMVIVENFAGRFSDSPRLLQQKLKAGWGLDIPLLSDGEALLSGKVMLLAGGPYANDLLCRLSVPGYLTAPASGYELRAISAPLEWRAGVIYFGGATPADVAAAIDAFLARYPEPPPMIEKLIEAPGAEPSGSPDELWRSTEAAHQRKLGNQAALGLLARAARDYNLTGNDEYAAAFGRMQRLFQEKYYDNLDFRRTSPHFRFHIFPTLIDIIEESPAFTDEDQARAAEIARFVSEEVMENGDMSLPQRLFNSKKTEYMTNHPMMAIRSMYFNADFLLRRYAFKPAEYWRDVAVYGMDCVSRFVFSPEDALAYQYHVPEIFLYYALGSGRYGLEFFRNEMMQSYMRYTFAMIDQRGGTVGMGDTYPVHRMISAAGLMRMLRAWVDLLDSDECRFYLRKVNDFAARYSPSEYVEQDFLPADLPFPGEDSVGLHVFPVRPDKFESLKVKNIFTRPVLDKAMFRSGWDPEKSEYLCLTGINGGPHGHFDANGIAAYVVGDFDWLADRDYVLKFPEDHNSVSVLHRGRSTEWSRRPDDLKSFSQLLGSVQRPDRRGAAISLLLEDYNSCNWRRHLAVEAGDGLWVIDEISAREPGEFLAECRFRVLGRPQPEAAGAVFRRLAPDSGKLLAELAISEGTGSLVAVHSQFDSGSNAREAGYFGAYAETGGANTAVLSERHRQYLQAGERIYFVNRIRPGSGTTAIQKLNDGVWRVGGEAAALAGVGHLSIGKMEVRAAFFKLDRHGLLAIGSNLVRDFSGREMPLGDVAYSLDELQVSPAELDRLMRRLPARETVREEAGTPDRPLEPLELGQDITALAVWKDRIGIGGADGGFEVRDMAGGLKFEKKFATGVTAVGAIPFGEGIRWAVGLHPGGTVSAYLPEPSDAVGTVVLLDDRGEELWRTRMLYGNVHRAIVRTLFPADFGKNVPAVLAGTTAWMYVVLDGETGEISRKLPVLHPATVGAAGDLDGDGVDEIAPGCEYYYTRIYRANGEPLHTTSAFAPYTLALAAADLNADGRDEFYSGRGDGSVVQFQLDAHNKIRHRSFNLGGPPAGFAVAGNTLFAVSRLGAVARLDYDQLQPLGILNTPILAFAGGDRCLAAAGADGRIYLLDEVGNPHTIYRYSFDPASVRPVLAAASEAGAVIASGSKLYIIR